jgi:hypothetical protein
MCYSLTKTRFSWTMFPNSEKATQTIPSLNCNVCLVEKKEIFRLRASATNFDDLLWRTLFFGQNIFHLRKAAQKIFIISTAIKKSPSHEWKEGKSSDKTCFRKLFFSSFLLSCSMKFLSGFYSFDVVEMFESSQMSRALYELLIAHATFLFSRSKKLQLHAVFNLKICFSF